MPTTTHERTPVRLLHSFPPLPLPPRSCTPSAGMLGSKSDAVPGNQKSRQENGKRKRPNVTLPVEICGQRSIKLASAQGIPPTRPPFRPSSNLSLHHHLPFANTSSFLAPSKTLPITKS
ncbi:hypothetical protein IE53DRAFT_149049 [Violaceomyces palustris]|uniref:Uncharacterized protein n=1 Tax=Violaceomyces palustris TaxID=1673888 RepID=A0ACD0P653_9BASI|nr:hypothetical protein IE53DRAFT_149049 [Violaceomyces palustris]